MAAGKKVQLTAKVTPKNTTNQKVTWKSGNKKYATVNTKGLVTTKKPEQEKPLPLRQQQRTAVV
ncbi:MAG: Ig-like domain-containing protein [Clostridiales bacterium]|nr:Ig-like domain-containing protein [Clostridiales bacterium]